VLGLALADLEEAAFAADSVDQVADERNVVEPELGDHHVRLVPHLNELAAQEVDVRDVNRVDAAFFLIGRAAQGRLFDFNGLIVAVGTAGRFVRLAANPGGKDIAASGGAAAMSSGEAALRYQSSLVKLGRAEAAERVALETLERIKA